MSDEIASVSVVNILIIMRLLVAFTLVLVACGGDVDMIGEPAAGPAVDEPLEVATEPPVVTGTPPPVEVPPCGNGTLEVDEECDDGNDRDGDGCDADCTYTCHDETECDPPNRCGEYACDLSRHVCVFHGISCDDGNTCTEDSCDPITGCYYLGMLRWYRDADSDCYGTPDDWVCSGVSRWGEDVRPPPGYVEHAEDCCDLDSEVKPRVYWEWFEEPHDCGGTWEPSFDYNCDGVGEMHWPDAGYCDTGTGTGCWVVEGWSSSVPACGTEGPWLVGCARDPDSGECVPSATDIRIQPCM